MPTLVELTAQIVAAHASGSSLSSEDLLKELLSVHSALKALEAGEATPVVELPATDAPAITIKQAFKNKDSVLCMICGKGFKTLKRHLAIAHGLKPGAYRKQFGITSTQSLAAKSYVESRRLMAIEKGLGEGLAKARAKKKADNEERKTAAPALKTKAPVPAVKKKPAVVLAKVEASTVPSKVLQRPSGVKIASKPASKPKK